MNHQLVDRRQLDFILYDWLDVESLSSLNGGREMVSSILDLSIKIAGERFLSHYKLSDQCEPRMEDGCPVVVPAVAEALAAYRDAGLFGAGFSAEHGGFELPFVVSSASLACFMAANISTSAFIMLTTANARLISRYGTPEQIEAFAKPQISGRMLGTMCLSEPQAGSSLLDLATTAVADGCGRFGPRYRLVGNKMWISGGDHGITDNIAHLVLAKVTDKSAAESERSSC